MDKEAVGHIYNGISLSHKMEHIWISPNQMWRVDSLERTLMLGGLGAGGEGDDRGWDGWMASLTRWTWVWVNSGSWWWTGRPGVMWFMASQRVGHNWATEQKWTVRQAILKSFFVRLVFNLVMCVCVISSDILPILKSDFFLVQF